MNSTSTTLNPGGLGIAAGQIGQQLRRALFGEKAGIYKKRASYDINAFKEKIKTIQAPYSINFVVFRSQSSGKIRKSISAMVDMKNSTHLVPSNTETYGVWSFIQQYWRV